MKISHRNLSWTIVILCESERYGSVNILRNSAKVTLRDTLRQPGGSAQKSYTGCETRRLSNHVVPAAAKTVKCATILVVHFIVLSVCLLFAPIRKQNHRRNAENEKKYVTPHFYWLKNFKKYVARHVEMPGNVASGIPYIYWWIINDSNVDHLMRRFDHREISLYSRWGAITPWGMTDLLWHLQSAGQECTCYGLTYFGLWSNSFILENLRAQLIQDFRFHLQLTLVLSEVRVKCHVQSAWHFNSKWMHWIRSRSPSRAFRAVSKQQKGKKMRSRRSKTAAEEKPQEKRKNQPHQKKQGHYEPKRFRVDFVDSNGRRWKEKSTPWLWPHPWVLRKLLSNLNIRPREIRKYWPPGRKSKVGAPQWPLNRHPWVLRKRFCQK